MESLLMEVESAMNLRRSFALSSDNNINNNMYGGFGYKSRQYNNYPLHHPHPSVSSISQLLLDADNAAAAAGGASFRGSLATYPPIYSSLPPVPVPVHRQPPLLPLPVKSATLPSSNKKISPPTITRSSSSKQNNNQKRKKKNQQAKTSTSPKKEPVVAKPVKKNKPEEDEETEEVFLIGSSPPSSLSVYSLSPPPSSLPLPRLLLMRSRPRTAKVVPAAGSCIAEAMGVGVDAGAVTSDLCKILRL